MTHLSKRVFIQIGKPEDDANNMVVVTEAKDGRVFYHNAANQEDKKVSTPQSFNQKYKLYGYQD